MKKKILVLPLGLMFAVVVGLVLWKSLNPKLIVDDVYLVGDHTLYVIDVPKLKFAKLYTNLNASMVEGKVLSVENQYGIFTTEEIYGEKNHITAWESESDKENAFLVEVNSRLAKAKVYPIKIKTEPGILLLAAVKDIRPARGGETPYGGTFDGDNFIWVIPHIEPTENPSSYFYNGIPTRYTEVIAYPVVIRSSGTVEYRYKSETLWNEQPVFGPNE